MPGRLSAYRDVAPPGKVDLLQQLSKQVRGQRMLHVNASRAVGGVAEMLQHLIPLLSELGIQARWEVMEGTESFYEATELFHLGLQGLDVKVPEALVDGYLECCRTNARSLDLSADIVMTHDVPPLALVDEAPTDARWLWQCHLDLSHPQRKIWSLLRPSVAKYDAVVFSLPQFAQPLALPQFLIYPSIDPLSDKNRELAPEELDQILEKLQIPRDKPILLEVSGFNRFTDPLGALAAYRRVKTHHDCRLVLAGAMPMDGPASQRIVEEVRDAAAKDEDVHLLLLNPGSDLEINALQRSAAIVIQNSVREGFGITVAEAMWKGKPVIAAETEGITLQVRFGQTGYTVNSVEGTAFYARYLLGNPSIAEEMGRRGREVARQYFLITRHVGEYLSLMLLMGRS